MRDPGRPVRVWLLSYNFRPRWAGPAERFMRYAPGLRARGVDMTFVTAMRPDQPATETVDGTSVIRVGPDTGVVEPARVFNVRAVTRALTAEPRPDVIIYIGFTAWDVPQLWMLRAAGIATIHVSTMARDRSRTPLRQWVVDRGAWAIERSFDRIVTSNTTLLRDHIELGVPPSRLRVISNGVSLRRFRPSDGAAEKAALRRELELPEHGPIALFVGLLVERKGVIELLEGWRRYRAGGGEGWLYLVGAESRENPEHADFYRRWDEAIGMLRPEDQLVIRRPDSRIERYFRAVDLFVFLSKLEGMPNVIPESMASGLPVLTARFSGFSDDLGCDGRDLVVCSRDADDVAARISELLGDPVRRHKLGAAARAWMEAHHDVERSLDAYAELCREVVQELRAWHRGRLAA